MNTIFVDLRHAALWTNLGQWGRPNPIYGFHQKTEDDNHRTWASQTTWLDLWYIATMPLRNQTGNWCAYWSMPQRQLPIAPDLSSSAYGGVAPKCPHCQVSLGHQSVSSQQVFEFLFLFVLNRRWVLLGHHSWSDQSLDSGPSTVSHSICPHTAVECPLPKGSKSKRPCTSSSKV